MKKIFTLVSLLFFSSCAIPNSPGGGGALYTQTSEIIYYDPYFQPKMTSTMCIKNVLGLFEFGDNNFSSLKLNSDIRKIATIEKTYSSRLLLFTDSCLVVKGE